MPPNNNNNEEVVLQLLTKRYHSLKIKLERTAYQIKVLGGELPVKDDLYDSSLDNHCQALAQSKFFRNEWIDKVIAVMLEYEKPFTSKEITTILYAGQSTIGLSGIYRQVTIAMGLLSENKLIEKDLIYHHKYILNADKSILSKK